MKEPPRDIEVFVRVVELRSFTDAAHRVGISRSYASRRVRALEDRLGVSLLYRNTRNVVPTSAGAALYDRARAALAALADAEAEASAELEAPHGLLRLTVPTTVGRLVVMPALLDLMRRFQGLQLDVVFTDRHVDLVEEGLDLAIRGAMALSDSALMARRLCGFHMHCVASPGVAERHPVRTVANLASAPCLRYAQPSPSSRWRFREPAEEVDVSGPLVANDGAVLVDAAEAGLGWAIAPGFLLHSAMAEGRLVEALVGRAESGAFWAVWPAHRHRSARVSSVVEAIAERLRSEPWSD